MNTVRTPANGWGARIVVRGCRRCGGAFRAYRDSHMAYCTEQCLEWDLTETREKLRTREAERSQAKRWEHEEQIRSTPLHVLYPGMMAVATRVQEWRPSHAAWLRAAEQRP